MQRSEQNYTKQLAVLGEFESLHDSLPPEEERWPAPMREEAFHGPAGEFVRLVEPHTEGDYHALLLAVLAGVGCLLGRESYYSVLATRHYPNLFVVIAGSSAKARKGTATDCAMQLLREVDATFATTRRVSGLSSGEGLIHAVRDGAEGDEEDAGVADKRLLVVETELAHPLQTARREGSTLSAIIRNAWDGAPLRILSKSNKDSCQEPHIGIIGNITIDETRRLLTAADKSNGFANRFLWCCAKRSKNLPYGGGAPDGRAYAELVARFQDAIRNARSIGQVTWSEEAKRPWAKVYAELGCLEPGFTEVQGSLTARGDAQCVRLAMLYALLDSSPVIRLCHLKAAIAVWEYCAESVRVIFADAPEFGAQRTILDALAVCEGEMSKADINRRLGGHIRANELAAILADLVQTGRVALRTEKTSGANKSMYRLRQLA